MQSSTPYHYSAKKRTCQPSGENPEKAAFSDGANLSFCCWLNHMNSIIKNKINKLPQSPGVYVFYGKEGSAQGGFRRTQILYVGKATNLRSRVSSYFRGGESERLIGKFIEQIADIKIIETESVLEALILESNLIKKWQPKYNAMGKDDKSFSHFAITKESFPRILIIRGTELDSQISNSKFPISKQISKTKNQTSKKLLNTKYHIPYTKIFGPYTSKKQMEIGLKIMRKIFPFHSGRQKTEKGCLDYQIGLCPGPYAGEITKEEYKKNIRGITMILEGKKKNLIRKLEKEMMELARRHEFEKAGEKRNKIFALKHIKDVALISKESASPLPQPLFRGARGDMEKTLRVEAYDISNISGQYAVGSMAVFKDSEPDKTQYRRFKIRSMGGVDDTGMMREVLLRRFNNNWPIPDLILLDGGLGHLNMGRKVLASFGLKIPVGSVAKGPGRKGTELRISGPELNERVKNILNDKNLLKKIMDEAHRFAVGYHRKLRKKAFSA